MTFYNVPPFKHFLNQTTFDWTQNRPIMDCKWYAYNKGTVTVWDTEEEARARSTLVEKMVTTESLDARAAYDKAHMSARYEAISNWKKCVIENIEAEFKFKLSEHQFEKMLDYVSEYTVDIDGTYDEYGYQIKILCEMLTNIGDIWNA